MAGDSRLQRLAAGHLILGVVAVLLFLMELPDPLQLARLLPPRGLPGVYTAPLFATALCQGVLLALWGAYAGVTHWGLSAGLIAEAACPGALLYACSYREESLGISVIALYMGCATAAFFLVARALGVRLIRETDTGRLARTEAEGLKLSIRGRRLFLTVVAFLIAVMTGMRGSLVLTLLLGPPLWAMCYLSVGPAAAWAALGNARPWRRGMLVLALSALLGAFVAFTWKPVRPGAERVSVILIMLLHASLLLGSLLVVRSCGYRLVRRAAPSSEPTDGGGPGVAPSIDERGTVYG